MLCESTLTLIRKLSEADTKTLTQKVAKLFEEGGELAKAALPYDASAGTLHRFVDRSDIIDGVADSMLVLLSIMHQVGADESELASHMLHKAKKWAALQTQEQKAEFPVPFEFHVTVRTADLSHFRHVCQDLGVKPIVLDLQDKAGKSVMHDVMTSSTLLGDNTMARAEVDRIARGLSAAGLDVLRKKIETVPWHPAAPTEEGDPMPKNCYFEAHVGVLCSEEKRPMLQDIAVAQGAHLSRNVFKALGDGTFKIMMTLRSYTGTAKAFQTAVEGLVSHVTRWGFDHDKVITEFSIYDTKTEHDSSWLDASP